MSDYGRNRWMVDILKCHNVKRHLIEENYCKFELRHVFDLCAVQAE